MDCTVLGKRKKRTALQVLASHAPDIVRNRQAVSLEFAPHSIPLPMKAPFDLRQSLKRSKTCQ
jgi:hypothetical protein